MRCGALIVAVVGLGCGRIGFDRSIADGDDGTDATDGTDGGDAPTDGSDDATPGQPVVCPAGETCDVTCEAGECVNGVVCEAGSTCRFDCSAPGSCSDTMITCYGDCDFFCNVDDTCNDLNILCDGATCRLHCCASLVCNANSHSADHMGDYMSTTAGCN